MSNLVGSDLHVFVELHPSGEGCYAKARIEGAPDRRPHTFVGVVVSRDEAVFEVTNRAIGWLNRLRADVQRVDP